MNRAIQCSIAILLVTAVAVGCQSAQNAARYSDEAIAAVKGLLKNPTDEAAIKALDDAVRVSAAEAAVVERAAVAWSRRVTPIRDRILSGLTATPDDAARVRAFVVGSTCDAFKEAAKWPNGIVPQARIGEIIRDNQRSSGLPAIIGMALLVADLTTSISDALADGDIGGSVPGLAQSLTCAVAAG